MNDEKIFTDLNSLHEAYKEYFKSTSESNFDLQVFALWLYNHESSKRSYSTDDFSDEETSSFIHGNIDDQISFILLNMHRLIKFYVKKATDGTKLVSIDDIHFLLYLKENGSMKKREIISFNVTEMSSGIEVIKRLIKNELVEDFEDPNDKRSKRVKLTTKGYDEINKITSTFVDIHRLFTSPLTSNEKFPLLASLSKLYNFHFNIFNSEKNITLQEILKKYIKEQ
ncbi:MAG: winged helix DNA-binding protein [Ignavibacteria bacterium]|jgi:DNA-binding MarR family transcriptional regulator